MASEYQSIKLLVLKNLFKNSSTFEALYNTYMNLVDCSSESELQKFKSKVMEPFLQNSLVTNQCNNISSNTCDICVGNHCQELNYEDKIMQFNLGALDLNYGALMSEEKYIRDKANYKKMRNWQKISNLSEKSGTNSTGSFKLKLLSFNILAQALLETYPHLYKYHDKEALPWEIRKNLLWNEIENCKADIICLQEMQEEHLADFVKPFVNVGYLYLYKKRTNEKEDGLLLLYLQNKYNLVDHIKVEYYRPGIELLSRDNVGLIAKFQLKDHPSTQFIVATTHLLYNPRRNDVRLGQVQLLFSDLEKMSFVKYNRSSKPEYLPIILCGDFNLEPYTGVYKFITNGHFRYVGKSRQLTDYRTDQFILYNSLIPSYLNITDDCQHFEIILERLGIKDHTQMKLKESNEENRGNQLNGQNVIDEPNVVKLPNGCHARFSTGYLSHPFLLRSVYSHKDSVGKREASTNQGSWITVDYIFYSYDIRPIEKYILPNVEQCADLPTIPNFAVGSDHLCLGATFEIRKKHQRYLYLSNIISLIFSIGIIFTIFILLLFLKILKYLNFRKYR